MAKNVYYLLVILLLLVNVQLKLCLAREITVASKVGRIIGRVEPVSFQDVGNTSTDITSFLGIPYAEPPTGPRRFLKPVPKSKFTETFNASQYGPSCPQNSPSFTTEKTDEDCLYLNIYTQVTIGNGTGVAVMVWIHGGGFILGDGRVFGGKALAAFGQVIIVSINYRLGPFGFLNTGDENVDPNAGLYDQHLAIKWVHDNIAEFGGDVSRITIFGESAGSVSVIHQTLYPLNAGLFQRAIAESGTANLPSALTATPVDRAKQFAAEVNCPVTSMKDMVKCLRGLNTTQILNYTGLWTPSYDGVFVTQDRVKALDDPTRIVDMQVFKDTDLLMGTNRYEGQLFIGGPPFTEFYLQLLNSSTPVESFRLIILQMIEMKLKEVFGDKFQVNIFDAVAFEYANFKDPRDRSIYIQQFCYLLTDIEFYVPTFTTVERHAFENNSSKTFQYEFNNYYPFLKQDFWIDGALHAHELPYVFGFPEEMKAYYGNYTRTQAASQWYLSSRMMYYWTNFAKSGDPNVPVEEPLFRVDGAIPAWKQYKTKERNYLYITSPVISNNIELNSRRVQLWTKYIPKLMQNQVAVEDDIAVCSTGHTCSISNFIFLYLLPIYVFGFHVENIYNYVYLY